MLHEKFDVWLRPKPVLSKVRSISCLCEKIIEFKSITFINNINIMLSKFVYRETSSVGRALKRQQGGHGF